ncbi:hypothetical protein A9239_10230 [Methanosarcina sp. A14]|nr:hypothetical protein A9239_10230 [Methanosarcina sp. A14]
MENKVRKVVFLAPDSKVITYSTDQMPNPKAVSQICFKFEVKFLRTMEKIDLLIWNFLPNNFLRFVILQEK